ncbi:O-antigen polymerase [Tuanshanicoccus lijuaniae]|uniref:O-antigen polymerase n=1 Tax=Aerococcaceae bacterium zg-1292 TaxID=2774330 RepID=UPI001BD87309|nr:oligosaccharide repeat unit polymerase [Aerococcaceae bacterium zg-A91]MBS4458445.1 oligosaccharide repeat unit polymerase [Aerococcaceae bacterium zg-BR33]
MFQLGLFILFLFLFLCIEIFLRKSILTPNSVMYLAFLFSSTIIFFNFNNWDVVLNDKFFGYVITAILVFAFGTLLARFSIVEIKKENLDFDKHKNLIYPEILILWLSILSFIFYIIVGLRNYTFSGSWTLFLRSIYDSVSTGTSGNFVKNQFLMINIVLAKINLYEYLRRTYILKSASKKIKLLIPVILFFILSILSTDRNILIRFIIYGLSLWGLFTLHTGDEQFIKKLFLLIKKGFVYIVLAIGLFYLFGKTKNYKSNLSRVVGLYGGSGLYNFNIFLERLQDNALGFGKYTLSNLFYLFNPEKFGDLANSNLHENVAFRSSTGFVYISNVYSSFRLYVQDFGYFGMIIFPLIIGFFYEKLYKLTMKKKDGFTLVIYSHLLYSIVYLPILEQFFQRLHLGFIYELFWLTFFYFLIYGKKGLSKYKFTLK